MTTLSLRIQDPLFKALENLARLEKRSKSDIIRGLIEAFVQKKSVKLSPWELGKDLFGQGEGSSENISINRKRLVKEKIRAKYANRHRRRSNHCAV